ncbi:MAG: pyridoxamine 5'-phosphate oxidase family protein [Solobacterium sp.]|nr:pyridoxamine 5'-phosphate oxidase family protein [Solobacterium sp.]
MFREMRRKNQQLSEEECMQILQYAKRGILSVTGEDGYPYGVPMDFVLDDSKLYFHCALSGHKLDAIKADNKVCFTVLDDGVKEEGSWWYHFNSVVCFGRIRIIEDAQEKEKHLYTFGMKYMPTEESVLKEMQLDGSRANILELTIDHMTGKRVREK